MTRLVEYPTWYWPQAAYVHVPFCMHHCGYCDFAVSVGQDHLVDGYLDALEMELSTLHEPQQVGSIFLGGGTPTYPNVDQLARMLGTITRWLVLEPGGEWSIEANPETLSAEKVDLLFRSGVTRVSLGAQSFHSHLLESLERPHRAEDTPRALELLRKHAFQVSLDLIFGAPGQTLDQWQADLTRALTLQPDHVSTYGLTYEKGTPLWKRREQGQVIPLTEENERELYSLAMETLAQAGFDQYEISNFARPGKRCRHNEVYWANEAYFGFGMGACRYVQGRRETNTRNLVSYIRRIQEGESAVFQSEELTAPERARETMAIQLRRAEGINRGAFREQTGFSLEETASDSLPSLIEQGFLVDSGTCVFLSHEGKFVADAVIARLL